MQTEKETTASITILNGPKEGKVVEVKNHLKIGRAKDIDILIHDTKASREHAEIIPQNGKYVLKDLHSRNGTFLNKKRITTAFLHLDDEILIGRIRLSFTTSQTEREDFTAHKTVLAGHDQVTTSAIQPITTGETIQPAQITQLDTKKAKTLSKRYDTLIHTIEVITSSLDWKDNLNRVAEKMFSVFQANRLAIFIKDNNSSLKRVACITQKGFLPEEEEIQISQGIANQVIEGKSSVIFENLLEDDRFSENVSITSIGIQSAMCAPLVQQEEIMGLIYLDSIQSDSAFKEDDLRMLSVIARSLTISMSNSHFFQEVQHKKAEIKKAYIDTVAVLVNTIEARDHYTAGHTWRVTQFSTAIGEELGWPQDQLEELRMAAALHDIGKISYSDTILRKPGKLTDEEYEKIKVHPRKGIEILENIDFSETIQKYILHHHERWDGQGYIDGLKGEDIPQGGRIIAVADTFDALTSDRPYRNGIPSEKAVETVKKVSGSQLDPKVVKAFLKVWKAGKIQNIIQKYNIDSIHSAMCPFCSTWITIPSDLEADKTFECFICKRKLVVKEKKGTSKFEIA